MKKIKKVFAGLMAVTSLAVGMTGISASAYNDTASMVLRNVPGAPGNITSTCLAINSKAGKATYYTSCDFSNGTNATLTVSITNVIENKSVTLTKSNRSAVLENVESRYAYITFCANLSSSVVESCIWSVS